MSHHAIPPEVRFWNMVNKTDDCWLWTGKLNQRRGKSGMGGYGYLNVNGKSVRAHRYSYLLHYGPFDESLLVCHSCDNPACVRPDHLFLGDALANQRDMAAKGRASESKKTHCPKGHPYDEANTRICKNGDRKCRECNREQMRLRYERDAERERQRSRDNYWRKRTA